MILLINLLITGIMLFIYVSYCLNEFDDQTNSLLYKLYMFTFMFILQMIINIFDNLLSKKQMSLNTIINTSVNNALLTVISYDVYNDLVYAGFYKGCTKYQKITILVVLIMMFITTVKILQILVTTV